MVAELNTCMHMWEPRKSCTVQVQLVCAKNCSAGGLIIRDDVSRISCYTHFFERGCTLLSTLSFWHLLRAHIFVLPRGRIAVLLWIVENHRNPSNVSAYASSGLRIAVSCTALPRFFPHLLPLTSSPALAIAVYVHMHRASPLII